MATHINQGTVKAELMLTLKTNEPLTLATMQIIALQVEQHLNSMGPVKILAGKERKIHLRIHLIGDLNVP